MIDNLPRVQSVRYLQDYRLHLVFTDGVAGEIDLRKEIVGVGGVFAALEDQSFFQQVKVSTSGGTIEWPNGVDLCPDVLYAKVTGKPAFSGVNQVA